MKVAILTIVMSALMFDGAAAQRIKLPMPVRDLEEASQQDPNDVIARYNLALGNWSQKKYDEAEANLRDALSIEPRFALAHLALAMLPFARRDDLYNEVLEDRIPIEWRDKVIESDRHYRTAFMLNPLLDLRILGAVSPKRSVMWDMDPYLSAVYNEWIRGFDDFQNGDYEGALLRLQRLSRDAREAGRENIRTLSAGLLWYRGLAAAHVGAYEDALADLRELLRRTQVDVTEARLTYLPLEANTYRSVIAGVLRSAGRTEESMAMYRELLENDAGAYMAHIAIANMFEEQGDIEAALFERRTASAANPDDFTTEIEIGIMLARFGELAEAEEALGRAAAAQPRSPRPWYVLGLIQHQTGRHAEARASFEKFLEVVPSRFTNEIEDARRRLSQLPE